MQYIARLPAPMKLYYNEKVYSPEYSSIDTILVADKMIRDGGKPNTTVLDVGCGTGMIGLGIKLLNPEAEVTLSDIDSEAVRITSLNAKRLGLDVTVHQSDMLPTGYWEIITANLPTYADEDMSQELHGPKIAYYSKEPLALYERLFNVSKERCKALVCECQEKYQEEFLAMAKNSGWRLALHTDFAFAFIQY